MHAQLPGDRADRPALGVMQAQDLRLQRGRDHRVRFNSPYETQRPHPNPGREHAPAETARQPRRARRGPVAVTVRWPGDGADEQRGTHAVHAGSAFPVNRLAMFQGPRRFGCAGSHCASRPRGKGTLMRHFLCSARSPGALSGRVPRGAAAAALIANCGPAQRLGAADRRARSAVQVTPVALRADVHLLAAAGALVEPMRPFAHRRHARSKKDWTTPCIAGINTLRRRSHASRGAEGPGFRPRTHPGLRLCGEAASIANPAHTHRGAFPTYPECSSSVARVHANDARPAIATTT
jgi:hypothetical protein